MLIPKERYGDHGLDASDAQLPRKLEAVEHRIRAFTRNRFQVRSARIEARSKGGVLLGASSFFKLEDTVQITCSGINDGLYVVKAIDLLQEVMEFDHPLANASTNRATLVRYPPDVVAGAIGILEYEKAAPLSKASVASETISRHAVSYRAVSAADSLAGYPPEVTAFLKPYMKACF